MTNSNTAVTLGMMGEDLIYEKINKATKTDDWYDSEKDGTIGKQTYEVKTLRLNHKYQGIFIDQKQWKKIDGVDINFWIRVPEYAGEKIKYYRYYADQYSDVVIMNGTQGRIYPLNRMAFIGIEEDEDISKKMLENSIKLSTWKRFK